MTLLTFIPGIGKWLLEAVQAKHEVKLLKAELKRLRASKRKLEKELAKLKAS